MSPEKITRVLDYIDSGRRYRPYGRGMRYVEQDRKFTENRSGFKTGC